MMQNSALPRATAYRSLALACATFLSAGVILASLGPSLPLLAAHVGQDVAALGGLFTAFSAGIIIAQFVIGPASRRFSQRRVLPAGMLFMGLGALGITFGRSLPALFGAALLAGIGFGGVLTAGNMLVAQLFAARSAAALNGVNVFFGVGSILGPALAGYTGASFGMPQAAVWVGAGAIIALAPMMRNLASVRSPSHVASTAGGNAIHPALRWLFGLLLLVYIGTEVGFGGWLTLYMVESARLDLSGAALVTSGFWLALTSGRAAGAWLGLHLAPGKLLMISLSGLLLGAAMLNLGIGHYATTMAAVLLFGLSCGPIFPTVLALVTRESGGATSLALALGNGGGLIIPAMLGLLLAQRGPAAAAGLVLAAAVMMIAIGAATLRLGRIDLSGRKDEAYPQAAAKQCLSE
jgi:fucose permease